MTIVEKSTSTRAESARRVRVLVDRCAGCQECVIRCPSGALSMEPVTWTALANSDACVGCRQCERTCPFSAIVVEGPLALSDRYDPPLYQPVELRGNVEETRRGYDTWDEAIAEANRCLECPDPTCVRGCPAHNDIPQFVAAIRERDLERAHAILARTSAIPDICSRVCNQSAQCEGACTWSLAGGVPVAVGRLERFVTDHAPVPAPRAVEYGEGAMSVGIVGSGPAAVGAAWDLVEAGASVTVYEKDSTPGGLPLWGIPDFTLPDDVATRPWRQLVEAGVDLRCDTPIAAEVVEHLLTIHDAVVMAHGAGMPIRLAVAGSDKEGVVDATMFLKGAKAALMPAGDASKFRRELGVAEGRGRRVLVLGAGNTAMDVARMARRVGLDATCVDWLDERFALARPDELEEARHEGVDVRFLRTLTSLHAEQGRVTRAVIAHTSQPNRTKQPTVSKSEFDELDVDLVVMAMGYRLDPSFGEVLSKLPIKKHATGMPHGRWSASGILKNPASAYNHSVPIGALALDREVGLWAAAAPQRDRVWVAGDALTGPSTVVEAMAQGRRAARSILDTHPARPDRSSIYRDEQAVRVLVAYASSGGTTAKLASALGEQLSVARTLVDVKPVEQVGAKELAGADVVVLGTWVEGLVVAKVHPAKAMREWLDGVANFGGKPVATFCTYGVNPRGASDELALSIEAAGGVVVASQTFGPHDRGGEERLHPNKIEAFSNRIVARVVDRKTAVSV